jgi:hypothetical protein
MYRVFFAVWIIILAVLPLHSGHTEDLEYGQYEIKAGFIYNIAKFVVWPDSPGDLKQSLNLYVLGSDPFGKNLEDINGRNAAGRRLEVGHASSVKELKDCHILFISRSEKERIPQIMEALKDSSILTVGDTKGYAAQGVMVNFYLDEGRIRIELNVEKTKKAKLVIGHQLLKLAKTVQTRQ